MCDSHVNAKWTVFFALDMATTILVKTSEFAFYIYFREFFFELLDVLRVSLRLPAWHAAALTKTWAVALSIGSSTKYELRAAHQGTSQGCSSPFAIRTTSCVIRRDSSAMHVRQREKRYNATVRGYSQLGYLLRARKSPATPR